MKKTIFILPALFALASCEMDFYRSDTMTSAMLKDDPGAAVYTTDGNYSLFKDFIMYNESEYSNNTYVRHYFQMTEFRGDNACLTGITEDPLANAMCYTDVPATGECYNLGYFWYISYKIIYGANSNIESIPEGASVESDHMLGENYFMRAICHLNLCNLFARPYARNNGQNPGVVLRTSTDCSVTERATVAAVYDQIVKDLEKAAQLMQNGTPRGDKGYISYDAARGLLTRVYLYMGRDNDVITLANEMLGADPASHLDQNIISGSSGYYANARTSEETLWCVAKTSTDEGYSGKSQIGSMYFDPSSVGAQGWCEIYWSDPLIELFSRYPQDKRFQAYFAQLGKTNDGTKMVHWPGTLESDGHRGDIVVNNISGNDATGYSFTYEGKTYQIQTATINTYPVNYVTGLPAEFAVIDEELAENGIADATRVYIRDNVTNSGIRNTYPVYTMSKFSWQDGDPMLASPVMIRWAEVILNRAEARAKTGDEQGALDDVNIIRNRAGLTGDAEMTLANYRERGYETVLDVVLDERRLELCFEGHRAIDLYRNGKAIDRRFAGIHAWDVLDPDELDYLYPYYIPYDEVSVSGIPQNEKLPYPTSGDDGE